MSYIDRELSKRPTSGDAPFGLNEIFFSRTNDRGLVQSGNEVFRRVSHFEWEELLGSPHKIIRHPDMPRGVFQLFWETIKRGEHIGAYVKNKSKDGLYYWVFAVVIPCEGGYLSVRIKPSSPLFEDVKRAYTTLLGAENDEEFTAENSRDMLLKWVTEKGFDDYEHFATYALQEEMIRRDASLGRETHVESEILRRAFTDAASLRSETSGLVSDFSAMRTIPHNLRVIASRIEPSGGPVTVLSQNYGVMSRSMSEWFEANVIGPDSNFSKLKDLVNNASFVDGLVRVLEECVQQFEGEERTGAAINVESELELLGVLSSEQSTESERGLQEVYDEATRITDACKTMQRQFLGLSSTRVLCKIESARLPESGETLSEIIDQLGAFQEKIMQRLERITKLCESIRGISDA
ncbi:PAS domain-containing protein [Pseudophaeobacter sp.]|uniref:PAS domain-containing protein n=1 Tax=Pseudophaeobacter sp. TaxID=1971739 RepID=UPI003298913F